MRSPSRREQRSAVPVFKVRTGRIFRTETNAFAKVVLVGFRSLFRPVNHRNNSNLGTIRGR